MPKIRLLSLDILRGFAVLAVLGYHFPNEGPLPYWFEPIRRGGWSGVDLFFVLSGFLIGSLLFEEATIRGNLGMIRFWIRRAFKIFPSYYFAIFAIFLTPRLFPDTGVINLYSLDEAIWYLFYFQNYFYNDTMELAHFWSLAIEEHFYIVLPLIVSLFGKNKKGLLYTLLGTAAVSAILRYVGEFSVGSVLREHNYFSMSHTRIETLLFGVIIALLLSMKGNQLYKVGKRNWTLILASSLFITIPFFSHVHTSVYMRSFGVTFTAMGQTCLLFAFLGYNEIPAIASLTRSPIAQKIGLGLGWIGKYSYNIYIWHWPLYYNAHYTAFTKQVYAALPHSLAGVLMIPFHLFFAIVLGYLATLIIEIPFLKVRDKFFPRRTDEIIEKATY